MLHQSSWKFCIYITELLLEHHLHIVIYVLHLVMGRNQSPSKFCVKSQMFCNVEFYKVNIVASIPSQ
jgi:hypothetical protein